MMRDDIKYIIAGEDGEHTGFPFLAMVRYAMAAAVTLLAVAVIVLVFHAVLRSEDVHLSVNNGFIAADNLWDRRAATVAVQIGNNNNDDAAGKKKNPRGGPATTVVHPAAEAGVSPESTDMYDNAAAVNVGFGSADDSGIEPLPKECFLGCGGGGDGGGGGGDQQSGGGSVHRQPTTQSFTLTKAKTTNLRVILIASNPSGRTRIDCNDTTVSLIDMHSPYKRIGPPLPVENFTVPPQTTITMQMRLQINDTTYIWDNYGGEVRFSVRVQVSSTVTSFPLGKEHKKQQTYTCQPVTVGLINDEAIFATDQVDCWTSSSSS